MEPSLSLYPEQALKQIDMLIRKAAEYRDRISLYGSADEIDWEIAKENIEKACLSIIVLLEQYGDRHKTLSEEARSLFQSVKADPVNIRILQGEPYLTWPWRARDLIDIFRSLHFEQDNKHTQSITPLLDMIRNAEYYITNPRVFKGMPRSEADVHSRIEGLIKCSYSNVITTPRLAKPIKSFDPDTGIPSLKTLVEYKYIKSYKDGKIVIDQILADIGGYQTDDYDKFVFVLYETHRLFPLTAWTSAIQASKPPNPIEVILLKGVDPLTAKPKKKQKNQA